MTKKIPPITAQAPRRSRRSPEELLSELEKKKQRLEKQLFKNNQEAIFTIGTSILQMAQFDVSTLTDEITEKIKTDPVYSQTFIRRILEDALNNL